MAMHSVLEARNNLSRLIAESRAGGEVVITNRGVPVAKIVPIGPIDLPLTGVALAEWFDANPLPPRLAVSSEQIDAQIQEARDSWE
ncbi:type II toxin-antitoxin system prevent-host-death family antitoxin [Microbacterium sp. Mu-80]|uniref:Antitoxin n=1 Tax=Microbacterium bandirmense TaxID=3122050 RepID=A0ABU8LCY7_9MICO